ncbi:AAA family ATPase [Bacillus halotolerans]|uniref:AAA family ATPase n=1 Tax=Bacillus halotolerans TaxID=260554 RepID=UPI000751432E|nr:AAA family ATPase [Bacillus halotolerans]KUP32317.1 AAA family ATPase [Bacillus halotolerans]MEC1407917.1 AAA family ATPase [Bacillus halotolerans]MEC1545377.1 AAA family ATPase [Bacillus halotolerans]PHI46144.1 AAA family ATPase [Bacillus halotolerans]
MFLKRVTLLRDKIPSFDRYPFTIPAVSHLHDISFTREVTFFVGENGSGKSTLLEAIADKCEFNTAGGSRNNIYELQESDSHLGDYIRLSWLPKITNGFFLRAESFYQLSLHLDEVERDATQPYLSYGGRPLHKQSHGESFMSLFQHRFKGKAIYLLDEPEAALSPSRQLAFLRVIHDLVKGGNVQFIIATHSPILLGYPNADIFSFDGGSIHHTEYESTEHVQLTRYFLEQREKILAELFRD